MRVLRRIMIGGCASLLLALCAAASPAIAKPDKSSSTEPLTRDVYAIVGVSLRNPTDDTSPDAALFNVAGVNLDVTWGQFSGATATAVAKQTGGSKHPRTDVNLDIRGLIPGGVYSVFYLTEGPDSENPLCPGVERSLPLTAPHPSPDQPDAASFVADDGGSAKFHGTADGALLDAQVLGYELVYHFDGQTWGSLPNHGEFNTQGPNCRSSFGEDAFRQIVVWQNYF
jgi:hypothetical protein